MREAMGSVRSSESRRRAHQGGPPASLPLALCRPFFDPRSALHVSLVRGASTAQYSNRFAVLASDNTSAAVGSISGLAPTPWNNHWYS